MYLSDAEKLFYLINHARGLEQAASVFSALRSVSVEPILIKGWAVACYYPFYSRQYSDIDICVAPEDYEKALEVIKEANLPVDLHCGLRHLDSLDWEELFSNSVLIDTEKGTIRVLSEEDHLRILCIHWLTDGGVNRERLKDVYYLIRGRRRDFDWKKVFDVVERKRREWVEVVIGIADIYFDLQSELAASPVEDARKKVPSWMIKFLEKQWKNCERIIPLHLCLHDYKLFLRQLSLRFPPNPINAMIEVNGSLTDSRVRVLLYQTGSFFKRFFGFLRRLLHKYTKRD